MIPRITLRIGAATTRSRLIDAALATALARIAEKLTSLRPASPDDPSPLPIITTIRTS